MITTREKVYMCPNRAHFFVCFLCRQTEGGNLLEWWESG